MSVRSQLSARLQGLVRRAAIINSGVWVVASGLGPDLDFPVTRVLCDGLQLPFQSDAFDLVISNAVIEHVGDIEAQQTFIGEHHRVGRSFIATTPNRWGPTEVHTRTVLLHWSPRWRATRREFTRLLSRSEFQALLPAHTHRSAVTHSPQPSLRTGGRADVSVFSRSGAVGDAGHRHAADVDLR
jgi:hypothetical protein